MVAMFSVMSAGPKNISAPIMDNGIPTVIHTATRRSNTMTRQMNTSTIPSAAFPIISDILSIAGCALSFQTETVTDGGAS